MQPSPSPYYSPRYSTMIPPPPPPPPHHSSPVTHHSSPPQPHHYSHPQYPPMQQPTPTHSPHHHPHSHPHPHQYVYPPTYPQSPYLCVPPSSPPHSQYPVQQVHVIPSYIPRPQIHTPPMHQLPVQQYVVPPKETPERDTFYAKLHAFREEIGEPIQRLPTLGFKELDLWVLYKEVTKRRGIDSVIAKKQWKEVAEALQLPSSCTDSGFRLRLHYKKYLEAFERKYYRPPPVKGVNKEPKKLERACSMVSTDSTVTQVAGENSGSSGSGRSGAGTSCDSMKRVTKKKRRASSAPQGDRSGADVKRRALNGGSSTKSDTNSAATKAKKASVAGGKGGEEDEDDDTRLGQGVSTGVCEEGGEKRRMERTEVHRTESNDKTEAKHNLSVLEAAVMAVDGSSKYDKAKKVDFSVLDDSTLKRYAKAYDVRAPKDGEEKEKKKKKSGKWKRELAESVSTHFSETRLVGGERETLLRFIQAIKRV